MSPMLQPYQELLDRLREDNGAWSALDFRDEDDESRDTSRRNRLGVLLCLLRDRRPTDHDFVRYLAAQVLDEARSGWGLTRSAEIAVQLLGGFRDTGDLPLLCDLKRANFDTECGIDPEYLAWVDHSAGREVLRREAPELAVEIEADPERFSESALAEWWRRQEVAFAADCAQMPIAARIEDAMDLGAVDEASRLVDAWEAQVQDDPRELGSLAFYRRELGQPEAAIRTIRRRMELLGDAWEIASARLSLVELFLASDAPESAHEELEPLVEELARNADWREVGLGRSILHALWKFAAMSGLDASASAWALDQADRLRDLGTGITLVALQDAVAASRAAGDIARERIYAAAVAAEEARIRS